MTEPHLGARGGNGRAHVSPDIFNDAPPAPRRSRGMKLDVTQLATVLLAMVCSVVVAWFSQQYQVKANTTDIARMERSVSELETRKETSAVEMAELRTKLDAIIARLDEVAKRLDRMDNR